MGVQRHLKVLGIFARLNYRDGKAAYLNDMPRVMEYLRAASHIHEVYGGSETNKIKGNRGHYK